MTDVIKSTGKKEAFKPEKIRNSIENAVKDAGFKPQQKMNVIEHASRDAIQMAQNMSKVETKQIRDVILNDLEQDDQQIANTWRQYAPTQKIKYYKRFHRIRHSLNIISFLQDLNSRGHGIL